jgi:high affinity Mn2+ porin
VRLATYSVLLALVVVSPLRAQQAPAVQSEPQQPATIFDRPDDARYWLSGQMNVIVQAHPPFKAAYTGDHSFHPESERTTSIVLTLFTGLALSQRTEVLLDVESAGGRGLSDAFGLAGFTDLDVVRNPTLGGAPYLARLMLHHTIALGGPDVVVARTPFSLATTMPAQRLEIRVGKFGTADFFDVNAVGSDSHLQFLNWTIDNNGAYDYAADTRGYTWGATVEYHDRPFSARFGEMLMPKVANGLELDWRIARAHAENLEVEWHAHERITLRALGYANHANMGDYREAVQRFEQGVDRVPTIENTRQQGRIKFGVDVNAEAQLTSSMRAFARWGWNEPHAESFAYTEVNNSVSVGADVRGAVWQRPMDKVGVALVSNGLSADHANYLRLGGSGFLLGDGALTYGRETIGETYYTAHVWRGVFASADAQVIANPGYNRDRGPVFVGSVRLHLDF